MHKAVDNRGIFRGHHPSIGWRILRASLPRRPAARRPPVHPTLSFDTAPRRAALVAWRAEGRLAAPALATAWVRHQLDPTAADWRVALRLALLAFGTLALAAGVVFFFAYNWSALPPHVKFALLALGLVACTAAAHARAAQAAAAGAAVFGAQVITGVLLATIGQAYQTGADAWQLFAAWALLAAVWAAAGRVAPPWWLVVVLAQVALLRWLHVRLGLGLDAVAGLAFGGALHAVVPHLLGSIAMLAAWEFTARVAPRLGLRGTTGPRLLQLAVVGAAWWLGVIGLWGRPWQDGAAVSLVQVLGSGATLAGLALAYRHLRLDLFALALAGTAGSLLATLTLARLAGDAWPALWLPLGLMMIGLSTALAWWLRRLAATVPTEGHG